MQEIERKFLVTSTRYKEEAIDATTLVQGFLNTHPERTVRVRIYGTKGFLTVKGKSSASGTTRFEWEKEISVKEAEQLMALCEEHSIEKVRYRVQVDNHIFEVDEFLGNNKGLTVAEIELQDENEPFKKPDWLGREVTGVAKYYNSQLSKTPYTLW